MLNRIILASSIVIAASSAFADYVGTPCLGIQCFGGGGGGTPAPGPIVGAGIGYLIAAGAVYAVRKWRSGK